MKHAVDLKSDVCVSQFEGGPAVQTKQCFYFLMRLSYQ